MRDWQANKALSGGPGQRLMLRYVHNGPCRRYTCHVVYTRAERATRLLISHCDLEQRGFSTKCDPPLYAIMLRVRSLRA